MKKFLIKISFFLLPLLLLILMGPWLDGLVLRHNLEDEQRILVMGDSHPETGIEDDRLLNVAQSNETYFFTYHKLKRIVSKKKIDTLIISYSPNNISYFQDVKTFGLNGDMRHQSLYPRYFYSFKTGDFINLLRNADDDVDKFEMSFFIEGLKDLLSLENAYLGEYQEKDGSHLGQEIIVDKIKIQFYDHQDEVYPISESEIAYLERIRDLTEEKGIYLILVGLPLHPNYYSRIPVQFLEAYYSLAKEYQDRGTTFLDFQNYDLPDDHYYDGDHINSKGAEKITKEIFREISHSVMATPATEYKLKQLQENK